MIAELRREKGMTQAELAAKMGVTDKAVSKWERDLSFPDVNTIPKLAGLFHVTVDELMKVKTDTKEDIPNKDISGMVDLALKGVSLAMGSKPDMQSVCWESAWPVWRLHNFLQRKMKTGDAGNRIIPIDFSKRLNIYNRVRKAWQVLRALFLSQKPVCCGTMV